jgi:hypothetical protein
MRRQTGNKIRNEGGRIKDKIKAEGERKKDEMRA